MRILFLSQIVPYPPDAGPKVKTWHVLRYLAERGHAVTLAAFVREEERQYLPVLEDLCAGVHPVAMHRSRIKDVGYLTASLARRRSFLIERDNLPGMRQLVRRLVHEGEFDCAFADQLTMTQFLSGLPERNRPVRIFDAHNAVYTIVDRMMKEAAPKFLQPVLRREADYVKRYEGGIVSEFEHTLAVTDIDCRDLARAVSETGAANSGADPRAKITVIPISIDTQTLTRVESRPQSRNILTLGTLLYPPNADGIRWFIGEVFPRVLARVDEATLTVIGKNPPADFLQAQKRQPDRIRVTGYVPELQPYLEDAALMVVPVRAGSGMRVRILEAFARGIPVVTTTIGLEGIQAEPGNEVLVADTPEEFSAAVVELLLDDGRRRRLADASRKLAETAYDWRVVLRKLDQVIKPNE